MTWVLADWFSASGNPPSDCIPASLPDASRVHTVIIEAGRFLGAGCVQVFGVMNWSLMNWGRTCRRLGAGGAQVTYVTTLAHFNSKILLPIWPFLDLNTVTVIIIIKRVQCSLQNIIDLQSERVIRIQAPLTVPPPSHGLSLFEHILEWNVNQSEHCTLCYCVHCLDTCLDSTH